MVSMRLGLNVGGVMKKLVLAVGLAAGVLAAHPGGAAERKAACYSPAAIEAEQAIRYMTDLMVVSSACQNTTYGEFRYRNRDVIIAYQKAMIAHLHGTAGFDKWNTAIANVAAQKQGAINLGVFCQQSQTLLKHASALDANGFRAYAAAQAATVGDQYAKCGGKKK